LKSGWDLVEAEPGWDGGLKQRRMGGHAVVASAGING
jgi:hypothetical protein